MRTKARETYRTNDVHVIFCSEVVLADLSASSVTHLQLLPLKLNIVGKELCEV